MILNNFVNQTKRFNFDKTSVTLPVQLVPAIYVLSKAKVILPNYSIYITGMFEKQFNYYCQYFIHAEGD